MNFVRILLLSLLMVSCKEDAAEIVDMRTEEEKSAVNKTDETPPPPVQTPPPSDFIQTTPNSPYSYRLVHGENGWGYQIYEDSVMRINQLHIPSLPGIRGFESEERAKRAADYVLGEINKGNFPPTVNADILRRIGAID